MHAKIIKPPELFPVQRVNGVIPNSVFLAGSIEMGKAIDWQLEVTNKIAPYADYIFNPRRDNWDASWEQSITNEDFNTQVSWEMTGLDIAQVILMYFAPETKSPITLLELGMCASSGKVIVCCTKDFWRNGNVEMVCNRFDISLHRRMEDSIEECKYRLKNKV